MKSCLILSCSQALFLTVLSASAVAAAPIYNLSADEAEPAVFIIQLVDEPLSTYAGGLPGLAATAPAVTGDRRLDARSTASLAYEVFLDDRQQQLIGRMSTALGRSAEVLFRYRHAYNGLAVVLSPEDARAVARLEGVRLLYREHEEHLLTDAGPVHVNADQLWGGDWTERSKTTTLSGNQEVPPSGSSAIGSGSFIYNFQTRQLSWDISHSGLSDVTAAHIHSGAVGVNGPVEITLDHTINPIIGAAILSEVQQGLLANQLLYVNIHTSDFPGGEIRGQILPTGSLGEGVIIGMIDTGINSGHPSFASVGGDGYAHSNPYGSDNYVGYCVANPGFCNDKLIGAWALHPSSANPTDINGHGSHTTGTAVGNLVMDFDLTLPTATYSFAAVSGVAPHANIVAYQVCFPSCPTSSTTAAVNQALIDGVHVLNYSISGGSNPWVETTAVAFRNAVAAGVVVAAAAGNAGPGAGTVSHQAPWLLTVGGATHERVFKNMVVNLTSASDPLADIFGEGATSAYGPAALVYAGDLGNPLCNPFDVGVFSGQIVVCDRGSIGRVQKGINVAAAGGGGMILVNDAPSAASLNADAHVLPASHVSFEDGNLLKAWMANVTSPVGRLSGGVMELSSMHSDVMASHSSRGPAGSGVASLAGLVKPDLIAPAMSVIGAQHAAFSAPPQFSISSGNSYSAPHAAGGAALIRSLKPGWSAVEIKSALMTTAVNSVRKEDASAQADPFDIGAGRLDLAVAPLAGYVMHVTDQEFIDANPATGGDPRTLNLASMADRSCSGSCGWTRTLRSALLTGQDYIAWIEAPCGVVGTVTPASFSIAAGSTQSIDVEVNVEHASPGTWSFARLHIEPLSGSAVTTTMPIAVFTNPGITIFEDRFEEIASSCE